MQMRMYAIAEARAAGLHRWPDAPDMYAYLRQPHRHTFVVRAEIEEVGSRSIEVNELQARVQGILDAFRGNFDDYSCEDLARHVMTALLTFYETTSIKVTVLEDGINGASVGF